GCCAVSFPGCANGDRVLVTNLRSTPTSGVGAKNGATLGLVTNLRSTPTSGVGAIQRCSVRRASGVSIPTRSVSEGQRRPSLTLRVGMLTPDARLTLQRWIAPTPLVGVERRFVTRPRVAPFFAPTPLVGVERRFVTSTRSPFARHGNEPALHP